MKETQNVQSRGSPGPGLRTTVLKGQSLHFTSHWLLFIYIVAWPFGWIKRTIFLQSSRVDCIFSTFYITTCYMLNSCLQKKGATSYHDRCGVRRNFACSKSSVAAAYISHWSSGIWYGTDLLFVFLNLI